MLARIIHFKKLSGTTMGTVALGAGAIDDAAAWCLLALVLAGFDGAMSRAAINIIGGICYVAFTLLASRQLLAKWASKCRTKRPFVRPGVCDLFDFAGIPAPGSRTRSACMRFLGLSSWVRPCPAVS